MSSFLEQLENIFQSGTDRICCSIGLWKFPKIQTEIFCSMENGHGSHRVRSMLGNFIHGSFFFSLYGNKWLAELTTKIELNYIVLEIIIVNIFSVLSAG